MWRVVCALIAGAVPGDPVSQGHQLAAEAVTAKAKLRKSLRGDRQQFLLVNVFEEDCFNPGRDEVQYDQFKTFAQTSEVPRLWDEETMRSTYAYSLANKKQYFMSCGQFNNVMHMLMHALAVARALNRTLVLPGFYFRKGLRRTRIDAFEEMWFPTGHFLNRSRLAASGYMTIEMRDFKELYQQQSAPSKMDATAGWQQAKISLPTLHIRALGKQPPRLQFFAAFGMAFDKHVFTEFPFAFCQQSAARWVDGSSTAHHGRYTVWRAGEIEGWWTRSLASEFMADPVLAFDSATSFGFGMDGLRFEDSLVTLAKEIHFVDDIQTRADRFIESSFGDEPFLAIHIRRGVDRLHEFCKSSEANECYGWPVGVHSNCYPPIKAVAAKIKRMLSWHNLSRAFLATDSPDARIFEDILKNEHDVNFVQAFPEPAARHMDEFSLPVDQAIAAHPRAVAFLGNFPSTVTVSILMFVHLPRSLRVVESK